MENAEKTVWRIDLPGLKKPIFVDAYLVRRSSGVRLLLIDPNRLLMEVCCFKPGTNVSVKVTEVLARCTELHAVSGFLVAIGVLQSAVDCQRGGMGVVVSWHRHP